jgi:hypothetical protein
VGLQRETAIRYLTAQVAKYRADLAMWRRNQKQVGAALAQSMVLDPLQALIDDGTEMLARLRRSQAPPARGLATLDQDEQVEAEGAGGQAGPV